MPTMVDRAVKGHWLAQTRYLKSNVRYEPSPLAGVIEHQTRANQGLKLSL